MKSHPRNDGVEIARCEVVSVRLQESPRLYSVFKDLLLGFARDASREVENLVFIELLYRQGVCKVIREDSAFTIIIGEGLPQRPLR